MKLKGTILIALMAFVFELSAQNLQCYQWRPLVPGLYCVDSTNNGSIASCAVGNFALDTMRDCIWIKGAFEGGDTVLSKDIIGYNGHDFLPFNYPIEDTVFTRKTAYDMLVYHGDLIMCLQYEVVKYNFISQQFYKIGSIPLNPGDGLECLSIFNDELYVGGDFPAIKDTFGNWTLAFNIARWDGNNWHTVGQQGINSTASSVVFAMETYNDKLYVGGSFEFADTIDAWNIASWDGNTWACLCDDSLYKGTNMVSGNHLAAYVFDMEVFQNNLYVTGQYDSICNIKTKLAYTSGTGWVGSTFPYSFNHELKTFENHLIIYTYNLSGESNIQYWENNQASQVDTGFIDGYATFINFHDTMYAGGAFDHSGNTSVFRLAKLVFDSSLIYDGLNQLTMHNAQLIIYPNPANETVTITADNIKEIIVTNLLGEVVQSSKFKVQRPSATIDIGKLPQGIYLLRVQTNNGWQVGKLVKE